MTATNGRAPVDVLAAMEATPETRAALPAVAEMIDTLDRIANMRTRDGHLIEMHRDELRGMARTARALVSP